MLKKGLRKILIPATIISSVIYLIWRIFFTIPFEYGMLDIAFSVCLLAVEIMGLMEASIHFYAMSNVVSPERPKVDESLFPDVDIFIATYNEPVELLYKTVNGCLNIDYPDKSKVHIYICDDGNRPAVRDLADAMNVTHVVRADNKHAKAGNLNNALKVSHSPLVVTLDADMIPMSDFLYATVPYFLTSEKIGFVQTPQAFYNLDLFQHYLYSEDRIPNEQDYFYKTIQVSRNKTNTVIYGGSNTIISRKALEEIGGFVTNVITEDFATGMAIQSIGYKCIAIDEVHASGLSPDDLKSLIKQRERWARGCIQTGKQLNILFRKGLSLTQKFSYLSSITYWYSSLKRLMYITSPIAFAVFGVVVVQCTLPELLIFWLPMHLLNRISIRQLSSNIRTVKWSNTYENILFPSLLPSVLLETFGISQRKFSVTRKDGVVENDKTYQIKHALPHIILGILTLVGIYNCITNKFSTGSMGYIIILYWLLLNSYTILMSIFFFLGRKSDGTEANVKAALDCTVISENETFKCVTKDLSEEGLSILLDTPKYVPYRDRINIELASERYASNFQCVLIGVQNVEKGYLYSFQIVNIEEEEKRQLLHLLYDRVPTIVQNLNDDVSSFDDIRLNLLRRRPDAALFKRKLPRIAVERSYKTWEGKTISLLDFNYAYISIDLDEDAPLTFTLPIGYGLQLECRFDKMTDGSLRYLVTNYKKVLKKPALEWVVKEWLNGTVDQEDSPYLHLETEEFDEMMYL